jgi:hypothetical protein
MQVHLPLLLLVLVALGGCRPGEPLGDGAALERPTRPGERLWLARLDLPGLSAFEVDARVGRPLLELLEGLDGFEALAGVARPARFTVWLRGPVHRSSTQALGLALGRLALPPGVGLPILEAAEPGRPPEPGPLLPLLGEGGWLVRVSAPGWPELGARLDALEAALRQDPEVSGPWSRAPSATRAAWHQPAEPLGLAPLVRLSSSVCIGYLSGNTAFTTRGLAILARMDPRLRPRTAAELSDAERAVLGWPRPSAAAGFP